MPIRTFDVECVSNWFMVLFEDIKTKQVWRWELFDNEPIGRDRKQLKGHLDSGINVSFNGIAYDQWLVQAYQQGFSCGELYEVSKFLIYGDKLAPWNVANEFGLNTPHYRHIDIAPLAPGIASLKIYGGRLDAPKLQDLPFDPNLPISKRMADASYSYCLNDLTTTAILFEKLRPEIGLRRELGDMYDLDLISKSDPQIAEMVLKSELNNRGVETPKFAVEAKPFYKYHVPDVIKTDTPLVRAALLQAMYDAVDATTNARRLVGSQIQSGIVNGLRAYYDERKSTPDPTVTVAKTIRSKLNPNQYLTVDKLTAREIEVMTYEGICAYINRIAAENRDISKDQQSTPTLKDLKAFAETFDIAPIIKALNIKHRPYVDAAKAGDEVRMKKMIDRLLKDSNPSGFAFRSPEMSRALANAIIARFTLSDKDAMLIPPEFGKVVKYEGMEYQMGSGGLHSCEKSRAVIADTTERLCELDVTSYYPEMIIQYGFRPEHLGEAFTEVYSNIRTQRVEAKKSGDKTTADSLKIVLNSSFGKFGSKYSALYDPQLLLQTTVSGQLCLLLLIETIHYHTRCKVVSANTDGIVVHSPSENHHQHMLEMVKEWEKATRLELEETQYRSIHSQDVNNYLALTTEGKFKGKGFYASDGLRKNPKFRIMVAAIKALIEDGVAIEDTIRSCRDIAQFAAIQKVKGGAIWKGKAVGGTVRWYLATNGEPITYATSGNKVPLSENAELINKLPDDFPSNIDYEFYIDKTKEKAADIGIHKDHV